MATYKCLSCGAIYDNVQTDGSLNFHACPPDEFEQRAVFDQVTGELVTPEVRVLRKNPRNENMRPDLVYIDGKPKIVARDPNDVTRQLITDAKTFIIAEGAGRAPYDPATQTVGEPIPGPTIPGK
jgi:rubredoxin